MGGFHRCRAFVRALRALARWRTSACPPFERGIEMLAEQRQIPVPSRVQVIGPIDLLLHQLPDHQLRLSASSESLLRGVTTVVTQGVLVIAIDPEARHVAERGDRVVVGVAAPLIVGVAAAGDALVRVSDIDVDEIQIQGADSSEVWASGRCRHLSVSAAGGSAIDCEALVASQVTCHVTGKASCRSFALDSIRAQVSGSASLMFGGHPRREEIVTTDDAYVGRLWSAAGDAVTRR